MRTRALISFAAALSFAAAPLVTADGIFADIQTSLGAFSADLHYATAPQTVANFISLAEGSRAWVDPTTGAVRPGKRFYDGLVFHRVIKDFMNQGGCPLGTGTSGPGYQFRDELAGGLLHDVPYRLSMANSGYNTNGSQFFVTAAPTPWLDGKHTVFGTVTQGQAVVDAINAVPTSGSPNDRPLTPVVIQSVTIRREGAAADGFDVQAQGLPVCTGSRGRLAVERNVAATWMMETGLPEGSVFRGFRSANLATWQKLGEIYHAPGEESIFEITLDQAASVKAFYQLPVVIYPAALGTQAMAGRTLTTNESVGKKVLYQFDATGLAGTGEVVQTSGTTTFAFTVYDQAHDPYRSQWVLLRGPAGPRLIDAALDSADATQIIGRCSISEWDGSWKILTTNFGFTLTK